MGSDSVSEMFFFTILHNAQSPKLRNPSHKHVYFSPDMFTLTGLCLVMN